MDRSRTIAPDQNKPDNNVNLEEEEEVNFFNYVAHQSKAVLCLYYNPLDQHFIPKVRMYKKRLWNLLLLSL